MRYKNWWDYFKDDPYEKLGRHVPDAFGQPMIVELTRIAWTYLDWLESEQGRDIPQFFKNNDGVRLPTDGCVHAWMEGAVRTWFLRRERAKEPRPAWLPPALPAEYMDI